MTEQIKKQLTFYKYKLLRTKLMIINLQTFYIKFVSFSVVGAKFWFFLQFSFVILILNENNEHYLLKSFANVVILDWLRL